MNATGWASRLASVLAIAYAGVTLVFGCSSDETAQVSLAEGCNINSDCNAPLVCAFKRCHAACNESRDCPPGKRCMANDQPPHVCQLTDEQRCTYNSDCPFGQLCGADGQCRDQCESDRDCIRGQLCKGRTCVDIGELDPSGQFVVPGDAAPSTGEPCLYNSDCRVPQICRGGACRYECIAAADCKPGLACVGTRCSVPLCGAEPNPPTGAGKPCEYTTECPEPLVCRGGRCDCECLASRDCASGYACVARSCVRPDAGAGGSGGRPGTPDASIGGSGGVITRDASVSTGGVVGSGGVNTGGVITGGVVGSGGVSTGGVITGGVVGSGGVNTGGVTTGGVVGSGGIDSGGGGGIGGVGGIGSGGINSGGGGGIGGAGGRGSGGIASGGGGGIGGAGGRGSGGINSGGGGGIGGIGGIGSGGINSGGGGGIGGVGGVGSGGINSGGGGGIGGAGGRGSGGISAGGVGGLGGVGGIGGAGGRGTGGGGGGVKVDAGKGGAGGSASGGSAGVAGIPIDAAIGDALIAFAGDACAPVCGNLVSHWTFDEGAGSIARDSVGTNDGFVLGATWEPSCKVGGCLRFDGSSAVQVNVPTGLPLGGAPRTVVLWFQAEKNLILSPDSALFQYGLPGTDGAMFGLITSMNAPGVQYFYGWNRDVLGGTPIVQSVWYHAAVVYDGSTVKLYIDGNLDGLGSAALATQLDPNGFTIGWRPPTAFHGDVRWTGRIDDVRVYARALSEAELQAF